MMDLKALATLGLIKTTGDAPAQTIALATSFELDAMRNDLTIDAAIESYVGERSEVTGLSIGMSGLTGVIDKTDKTLEVA